MTGWDLVVWVVIATLLFLWGVLIGYGIGKNMVLHRLEVWEEERRKRIDDELDGMAHGI